MSRCRPAMSSGRVAAGIAVSPTRAASLARSRAVDAGQASGAFQRCDRPQRFASPCRRAYAVAGRKLAVRPRREAGRSRARRVGNPSPVVAALLSPVMAALFCIAPSRALGLRGPLGHEARRIGNLKRAERCARAGQSSLCPRPIIP